jgi:N6-adenosine-specific RNA methylase IME4
MSEALDRSDADIVVARLLDARMALASVATPAVAKHIADVAAASEVYARRQQLSEEVIAQAHALKIEALARLGELLRDMRQAGELSEGGRPRQETNSPRELVLPTNAELGIDARTSMVAQQLAALPAEARAAVAARETSITAALREHRINQTRQARPAPIEGCYRVIYADPPWEYGNSGVINDGDGYGRAERHYPTLSIDELCALPVGEHVADDAVLFLWVTSPLLAECWPVIDAWGFTYKTSMVWDKVEHNYGHYVSVRHELLLICTRGSCLPDRPVPMPDSVVTVARSDVHSQKPAEFRALIERLYDGPKLELFARTASDGWTSWGNQVVAAQHDAAPPVEGVVA